MTDLASRAQKTGCTASKFLSPAQAQAVSQAKKIFAGLTLVLDGGFDGAERVRAVFVQPDWGAYVRTDYLRALKIDWRAQDTVGHRDILGALLGLGLDRAVLGDILLNEAGQAAVLCLPEVAPFIVETLTKAGRVGLRVQEIPLNQLTTAAAQPTLKTDTVASLRLDAVLGAAWNLSRAKAAQLIAAGRVSVNHLLCEQPDKQLEESDLFAVRGLGRAQLLRVGNRSKKGRLFIEIGVF